MATVRAYLDRPRKHVTARGKIETYGPGVVDIPEVMAVGLKRAGIKIDPPDERPTEAGGQRKQSGEPRRQTEAPPASVAEQLPDDLPGIDALRAAGLTSAGDILAYEDLTQIPGIGKATAAKILAALEG